MKLLVMCLLPFYIFADEPKNKLHKCFDADLLASERLECVKQSAAIYAQKLNYQGSLIYEKMPEYKNTFSPYLNAWNIFAKKKCMFETSIYEGGSGRQLYYYDCFIRYANDELMYLQKVYKGEIDFL